MEALRPWRHLKCPLALVLARTREEESEEAEQATPGPTGASTKCCDKLSVRSVPNGVTG